MGYSRVKIGKTVVYVETADSFLSRMRGLMLRQGLERNKGMLLTFERDGYYSIWMFGMQFSIDIIWINDRCVVDIVEDAKPCLLFCKTYVPKKRAKYVLEVNSGFVEKHKIKLGTKVYVQ